MIALLPNEEKPKIGGTISEDSDNNVNKFYSGRVYR